jgi:transcriptional regulator with XRE-family HTH domain
MRTDGCPSRGGSLVRDAQKEARAEACRRFGEAIRALRRRYAPHMKIKDIADRSGYSATSVSEVLNGKRFPSHDLAECITRAIGANFEEIRELWNELSESVSNIVPVTPEGVSDETIRATWFQDNSEFYAACRQGVMTANRQIRTTYVRQYPPNEVSTDEAAKYFAAVLDWAGGPGPRSVKRIYGVPVAEPRERRNMVNFLQAHLAETEGRELKNYQARVYEYTARADGLNMALFDEEVAFLAISEFTAQDLSGMRIDNPQYTKYLVKHFDQLLSGCTLLADYLDDLEGNA